MFLTIFLTIALVMFNFAIQPYVSSLIFYINSFFSIVFFCGFIIAIFLTPGIQINHYSDHLRSYDPSKFCVVCSINRKKGTKHCNLCDLCILDKGKHIHLFEKCIGRYTKIPVYSAILSFIFYLVIFLVSIF